MARGACDIDTLKQAVSLNRKVLVVVGRVDCPACGYFDRVLEKAAPSVQDEVALVKVYAGEDSSCKALQDELNIMAHPTAIFYSDGKEVDRIFPTGNLADDVERIKRLKG